MIQTLRWGLKFPKRSIHSTVFNLQSIRAVSKSPQVGWENQIKFWMRKYLDLFGITKLSEMHETVLETQKSIQDVQDKRRKIQEDLFIAQKKLQESRNMLHKIPMDDSMYISVVIQVHELIKEQGRLQQNFSSYDQTERELQTILATAIKESQEHEQTHRGNTKYLCLVTGVAGGLLGFLESSINNWRLRREIKLFANNISDQVNALEKDVERLNSEFVYDEDDPKDKENVLLQIKSQQELFHNNVRTLQSLVSNNVLVDHESIDDFYLDSKYRKVKNQLLEDWDSKLNYHTSLDVAVISSLLLFGTFLLYIGNSH